MILDKETLNSIDKKITVIEYPFPYAVIENFLPIDLVKKAESDFTDFKKTKDCGNVLFQKNKKSYENYSEMPSNIKNVISFFYSKEFIKIIENKFNLRNIDVDWNLHGGGMHESFNGGFLKVHTDFLYKRKSKTRRVLNILLYLNSDWDKNWGGSIEFWDKEMSAVKRSVVPSLNTMVIFRTDKESHHGFPDPIKCPKNISRKSIALYYYVNETGILPFKIKKRRLFHAVWKKRPNINEPNFAENDSFFKRLKHKFFYRFF